MAGTPTIQLNTPLTRAQLDAAINNAQSNVNTWIKRIKFSTLVNQTSFLENYNVTLPGVSLINPQYDSNYYLDLGGGGYFVRISFPKLNLTSTLEGDRLFVNLARRNSLYLGGYEDIIYTSNQTTLNAALAQYKTYLMTNFPPAASSIGTQVATSYRQILNFELRGATTGTLGSTTLPFKVVLEYKQQGLAPGTGQQNTSTISGNN